MLLAQTIAKYIIGESKKSGTYKFILPSYPSYVLVGIGNSLDKSFSNMVDRRIKFLYGIAYRLGARLQASSDLDEQADFRLILNKGWFNKNNNLTLLRNEIKPPEIDTLVTVLAGYEDIDDQGGLSDFFHLDQSFVWKICLKKSFKAWIDKSLEDWINLEDHAANVKLMDELFCSLYNTGLADLLSISRYLQNHSFSGVSSGSEAYGIILEDLKPFMLPKMIGLESKKTRKPFSVYQSAAMQFFNYSSFLNASERDKSLKRLKYYRNDDQRPVPSQEELGEFDSVEKLLDALEDYITNRSEVSRESLYSVDFVYLYERVLGYKPKIDLPPIDPPPPVNPKVRKIEGVAPEVFLHALWLALGDLRKETKKSGTILLESIKKITIRSILFKHDFDAGKDEDSHEIAKGFLIKALGGIDEYLDNSIRIPRQDCEEDKNRMSIDFEWRLSPTSNNNMGYTPIRTGEPNLRFDITISYTEAKPFKQEFVWLLPEHHQTRFMVDIFGLAREKYLSSGNLLPAFAVPYLSEVFTAREEEECTRLLQSAFQKQCDIIDLLNVEGLGSADILKDCLLRVSYNYQEFLGETHCRGFFTALNNSGLALKRVVDEAYKTFINHCPQSVAGPLLWKAFMVVGREKLSSQQWAWEPYVDAAIVTPLHPVLLEMMMHQYSFLCDSFCFYAEEALQASNEKPFAERYWYRVVDLSTMQWPALGTLTDFNLNLNANVKSFGYIHLIGVANHVSSFLDSRLLKEYEDDEDDIADGELFRETQASVLIKQILGDYQSLHPFAHDGMTIGAYCGLGIQPLIAGIDRYLAELLKNREEPFALRLNIFSDSKDDSAVMRWVNAWKDRWQQAELSSSMKHYANCRISIAYRVVSRENNAEQFKRLIKHTEMDIMFFADFIDLMGSRFEPVAGELYIGEDYRRFPVLEKVCCKKSGGGQDYKRERVLSNQRFQLGSTYAEVMVRLKDRHAIPHKQHVVISYSDFFPWVEIVNEAHAHSTWVVCIDPSVDEQLLLAGNKNGQVKREIVGFGSGVGAHGENNFTVSTEHFTMLDISEKISSYTASLFAPIDKEKADVIAESLRRESLHIAGLSVIKATGPIRFVREFIANALVRKLLPRDPNVFCDEIFSLDAFIHWFDDPYDNRRPDLVRIKSSIVNGYFNIEVQLIECKLAQQSEGFLQRARGQIDNGLKQLLWKFKPRQGEGPIGIYDPPNQRYWWMQLHRLIASKGETNMAQYNDTLLALERLSEGCFTISWQAAIVAIWTDLGNNEFVSSADWEYWNEGQSLDVCVAQIGKDFLQKACLENQAGEIFVSKKQIIFEFTPPAEMPGDQEKATDDTDDTGNQTATNDEPEQGNNLPNRNIGDKDEMVIDSDKEKSKIPDRIMLGTAIGPNRNIYWEFGHKALPNRHLLIFGASGTGKTYTVQSIIYELARYKQNSLIVDYTNGFTTNQLETVVKEVLKPQQHIIRMEPLPINPFRQQCDVIEGFELMEDPATTAGRVSGVFAEIYQLGDQQKSALYTAIRDGVERSGDKFNMSALMQRLDTISTSGGPTAASAASVITKIQPFIDTRPFGAEDPQSWERIFSDDNSRCHIIQLAGFMKEFSRLITEFSLIDLYRYYRSQGDKDRPKVVILDEIQNLDHRLESPLGQFLTEGRKFGISLVLATQTLSNLGKDERDRLFQASHKLFFKPADTEIRSYAGILADATGEKSDEWVTRLASLKRGECYSLGFALNERTGVLEPNKWFKTKISEIESRVGS